MERAKPYNRDKANLVAEELYRPGSRVAVPMLTPGAGRNGGGLDSPNLLCTRPDVYIKVGAPGDGQGACALRRDSIGSCRSGGVENSRAPDVHSAECI